MHFPSDCDSDHTPSVGFVSEDLNWAPNKEQASAVKEMKDATAKGNQNNNSFVNTLDWPTVHEQPFSENGDTKTFALAFPWLFSGGVGDFVDRQRTMKLTADEWG